MDSTEWTEVKQDILQMILAVEQYCLHLRVSSVRNKVAHETPRSIIEEKTNVKVLKVNNALIHPALSKLDKRLEDMQMYNPISIRELLPTGCDRQRVYDILEELKRNGWKCSCVHYAYIGVTNSLYTSFGKLMKLSQRLISFISAHLEN